MKFEITVDSTKQTPQDIYKISINDRPQKFTASNTTTVLILETTKEDKESDDFFDKFKIFWIITSLTFCVIGWLTNQNTWINWFLTIELILSVFALLSFNGNLSKMKLWHVCAIVISILIMFFHSPILRCIVNIYNNVVNIF